MSGQSQKRVVLYGYNASPYYQKTINLLAHYRVPFDIVTTDFMPPRPMLSEELNITYRKIPVVAIDGQVYFDTALIAQVLEELFGGKPGHGSSLFQQHQVVQQRLTSHWFDQQLFPIGAFLIPAKALTKEFIEDRVKFGVVLGKVPREHAKASLRIQLTLIEEQLKDNELKGLGPYLLGTKEPEYVDLGGAYTGLNWIQSMQRSVPEYLPLDPSKPTPFPLVIKYLASLRSHIKQGLAASPKPETLVSSAVAKTITEGSAKVISKYKNSSKVDENDPLVQTGKLKYGDQVEVTPMDTGRTPQRGELVAFSTNQVTIVVLAGPNASNAPFLAHFPRLNYKVQRCKDSKM